MRLVVLSVLLSTTAIYAASVAEELLAQNDPKKCADEPPQPDDDCIVTLDTFDKSAPYDKDDIAEYTCADGYQITGKPGVFSETLVCKKGKKKGSWKPKEAPTCEKITCGEPAAGEQTVDVPAGFTVAVGGSYTYACLPGYTTSDPLTATCQNDATYDIAPPKCKVITCKPGPDDGTNTVSVPDETKNKLEFGDFFTYECRKGFSTTDPLVVTCNDDGTLSNDPPTCEKIECPAPPAGVNTKDPPTDKLEYLDTYTYECKEGFTTSDETCTVCQPDGTLSLENPPECTEIVCGKPAEGTGTEAVPDDTTLTSLQTYTYVCEPGFFATSEICTVCLPNGEFSLPSGATCEEVKCKGLEDGENTVPVDPDREFSFLEYYEYECEVGFTTDDDTVTICMADGTFSLENPPKCKRVTCDKPEPGTNTKSIQDGNYKYEDEFTYRCKNGFSTEDPVVATCMANGFWSISPPVCTETGCGAPPDGTNTVPVAPGTSIAEGDSYTYDCLTGYVPYPPGNTDFTTTCTSGTFDVPPPTCTMECETGDVGVTRGVIPGTNCQENYIKFDNGNVVNVECSPGSTFSISECRCVDAGACCPAP